ncbi:peptidylprolyl isomerase [Priestia filamentosa]|uniref:peptidylprolyl isomerase n=1 Tax=Priestia filamentosa TaxID=1402861 RepID=UPI000690EC38
MKKKIIAAAMTGSILLLGACSANNETIAKVGNDAISKEEFYQQLKTNGGTSTLQSMIENSVLTAKYKVSNQEIEDEINRLKSNFSSDDEFKTQLAQQYNINTDEDLKVFVEQTLLRYKAIADGVKVTDKQLEQYYKENKDNYISIEASHILVDKKEDAEKLLKELKNGADFAKLAKENSKDGSALNGGALGKFGKGQMVPEFENVAFSLKENEISDVVKTDYGYHIIKVTKIDKKTLKNAKEQIKKDYIMETQSYPEEMVKLLKKAKVKVSDKDYENVVEDMLTQYQTAIDQAEAQAQTTEQVEEQSTEETTETAE